MIYVKYSTQIVYSYSLMDAYNLISRYQELYLEASLKLELLLPLLRNNMALTCVEIPFRLLSSHSTQRFSRLKCLLFNILAPVLLDIFFSSFEIFICKLRHDFRNFNGISEN